MRLCFMCFELIGDCEPSELSDFDLDVTEIQ